MTDRLCVWFEAEPLTGYEARKKLERAYGGEENVFAHHDGLDRFYQAVCAAHAMLSPCQSAGYVQLSVRYSGSDSLIAEIADLARQHDLVCFSSRTETVFLPPRLIPPLNLLTSAHGNIAEPGADIVKGRVRQALLGGGYATISREIERYVQAGAGPSIGHKSAAYAVEYRNGSVYSHYRYETDDVEEVVAVFADFLSGSDEYQSKYAWRQYVLELP